MLRSRSDEKRTAVAERFARAIEDEAIETHVVGCVDVQDRTAVAIAEDRLTRNALNVGAGFESEPTRRVTPGRKEKERA
jgi:hypothetical protein